RLHWILALAATLYIGSGLVARGNDDGVDHRTKLGLRLAPWQSPHACGPNCLFVFLCLHECVVTHEEVIEDTQVIGQDASMASLQACCTKHGLAADVVFANPEALHQIPLP